MQKATRLRVRQRWGKASLVGAIGLSLAMAAPAGAASWSSPFALVRSADVYNADLAAGASTALVAYEVATDTGSELYVRRSANAGDNWKRPILLAANGQIPAVAGYGSSFDVVWNTPSGRVRYARSTDGGTTFSPGVPLSPLGRFAWRPQVARGASGVVAVIWEDVMSHVVKVRVSDDGGVSFGSARTLTTSGAESGLAVAVGQGVIYAAYSVDFESIRLRRSLDHGATWSAPVVVTDNLRGSFSLAASGRRAFVAFDGPTVEPNWSKVRYRATADWGATWSTALDLAPATWTTTEPDISFQAGVLRAVFERCTPSFDTCDDHRVYYRQLVPGSNWSAPERVSPTTLFEAVTPGVGYAGKIVVLYLGDTLPYVRTGTP